MLVVLSSSVKLVGATGTEVVNLIANYQNYIGALIILIIGLVSLLFGSLAYGILKKEIKNFLGR